MVWCWCGVDVVLMRGVVWCGVDIGVVCVWHGMVYAWCGEWYRVVMCGVGVVLV